MEQAKSHSIDFSLVESLATAKHNKVYDGIVQYGTAGFRTKAEDLNHVLYRMGLLTVLRSKVKKATIGLMITASHNPEIDNGAKLVDPAGEMLEASWEEIATQFANVEDKQVVPTLQKIIKEQNIDIDSPASVIIGRDTRNSSPALSAAATDGVKAMNSSLKDFGVVTTPQLHYLVVCTNTHGAYGVPTIEGYYEKICEAYKMVISERKENDKYTAQVVVDAANGVGALALKEIRKRINKFLEIQIYNDGDGQLNSMCGADYVKINQKPPKNIPLKPRMRYVSIDGDADRIVYFYTDVQNKFHLLDGDRIAILVAAYLKELVEQSQLDLQLGLVQTAYANGASTAFITENLKVPVECAPTGVKHLHHRALEFDVGVYFEANGHGTVVFKDSAIKIIRDAAHAKSTPEDQRQAAQRLSHVIDVINQAVGDAISDMLLVELILNSKGWDIMTWENSYHDLPNRQVKVKVQDRNTITTTDAERHCVKPQGLQERIDQIVSKYRKGRSFVRPSGTEDVVRVYAECEDILEVEKLAAEVSIAVYEMAGGIGPKPLIP